jgi:hypothetical protein
MIDEVHESDLRSWRQLNAVLKEASEDACNELLTMEKHGQARLQFLNRIHGAYNKRRYERERLELASRARSA